MGTLAFGLPAFVFPLTTRITTGTGEFLAVGAIQHFGGDAPKRLDRGKQAVGIDFAPIARQAADTSLGSDAAEGLDRLVQDLLAVERSGAMRGRYFVLGRLLSPLDGIGPEELPLPELMQRIVADGVTEVILATPPSVDGEATALLLARELSGRSLKLTRIASGVPHGGDLEFADPITLGRAMAGRRGLDG